MRLLDLVVQNRPEILRIAAKHGARDVRLFGSVARGEEHQGSDIDLLADFDQNAPRKAWTLPETDLGEDLGQLLGVHVDVVRKVHPFIREHVAAEAIPLESEDFSERAVIESQRPHMALDRDKLHLVRMYEACANVIRYASVRQAQFQEEDMRQQATIQQITQIGEAARAVSPRLRRAHPEIPWKEFVDLRNIAVHLYYDLEMDSIWPRRRFRCLP